MCSINGVFSQSKLEVTTIKLAKKTASSLSYRGPDEFGELLDDYCYLASNRFSITGVKSGKMPIYNEDGNIVVIQNGEIYNYRNLRQELKKNGHYFSTDSDTEVIVHGYEEYGEEIFQKLIGMFAIAIYDKRQNNQKLILARDRFGEKPLFYTQNKGKVYFASEANSLLDCSTHEIDYPALAQYFALGFSYDHLIKGIKRLQPSTCIVIDNKEIKEKKYWNPIFNIDYTIDFEECVERYENILQEIIYQMIPFEVEYGTFNSGGLDSSLIASILVNKINKLDLVTSGLVVSGKIKPSDSDKDYSSIEKSGGNEFEFTDEFNEFLYRKYGDNIRYNKREFSPEEYQEDFFSMVNHLPGGPVKSTSFPLFWFSAMLAKKTGLRVCLSGEGADELFGGYKTSDIAQYKIGNEVYNFACLMNNIVGKDLEELIRGKIDDPIQYTQEKIFNNFEGQGKPDDLLFNKVRYMLSQGLVIAPHMLEKGDGMTMAFPIEMRMPYLDKRSAEFLFKLPVEYFIMGETKKRLLRELAKKYVPEEICTRPKQRTSLPYGPLYNKLLKEFVENHINRKAIINDYLNPEKVSDIVHSSKKNPRILHSLLILESWLRNIFI